MNSNVPDAGSGRPSKRKKISMTKQARAAARRRLPGRVATGVPKTMPSSKTKIPAGVDPTQNNPNDIGAVIIPQATSLP